MTKREKLKIILRAFREIHNIQPGLISLSLIKPLFDTANIITFLFIPFSK